MNLSPAQPDALTESPATGAQPALRLLMVDDEAAYLSVLEKRLERRNIRMTGATSGAEAVAILRSRDFDTAIIDLKMGDMDGLLLLKIFKMMVPAMPVIILTGHGSEREARKGLSRGASDYITKPCELSELIPKVREAVAVAASGLELQAETMSILICDDEKDLVEMLSLRLTEAGNQVMGAFNGRQCLEILENEPMDAVLLDLNMPETDGIEVLRLIKRKHPLIEVILMTGYGQVARAVDAMKLGAADFLEKPLDFAELKVKLKECRKKQLLRRFRPPPMGGYDQASFEG